MKSLRAWRTERQLSTRRLAELARTSNKTIVQIENGRQTATFATIGKICNVLRIEPREVTEFARAIDARARIAPLKDLTGETTRPPLMHVLCISTAAAGPTLSRRLLEAGRYGVTTSVAVPLDAARIACIRPDVLLLDLEADFTWIRGLLRSLRADPTTNRLPIVVTGRDPNLLDSVAGDEESATCPAVTVVPFSRDLRELLAAIDACAKQTESAEFVAGDGG